MRFRFLHFALAGAGALSVAACSPAEGRYPSLAKRDAERMVGTIAAPDAPVAIPPTGIGQPRSPDSAARLAAIAEVAELAHAAFLAKVPQTRAAVGDVDTANPASPAWASAQVALASLESARSTTMFALADIDSLLALRTVSAAETGDRDDLADIVAVRSRIAAQVAEEDAILAELRAAAR